MRTRDSLVRNETRRALLKKRLAPRATAIHDHALLSALFLQKTDLHHTALSSNTPPVPTVFGNCGSHSVSQQFTIWDLHESAPFSPAPTLSLKMGHKACALLFLLTQEQTSLGATSQSVWAITNFFQLWKCEKMRNEKEQVCWMRQHLRHM